MKYILIFLLFFPLLARSQDNNVLVRYDLIDSLGRLPVSKIRATVAILSGGIILDSVLFDTKGRLKIMVPGSEEKFLLTFYPVGYSPVIKTLPVKTSIDLGRIYFKKLEISLDEVKIKGLRKMIEFKNDRSIYTISKHDRETYPNLTELIKKVPLVSVTAAEGVKMRGESTIRLFLNGKPTGVSALNASEYLKTIPLESIKKVEFISGSSAKNDAEGSKGTINIITIDGLNRGYFLSLASTVGNLQNSANSFYSLRSNKFSLSAFAGTNRLSKTGEQALSNVISGDTGPISQYNNGERSNRQNSPFATLTASYQADSTSSINLAANYYGYNIYQKLSSDIRNESILIMNSYRLEAVSHKIVNGADINLDYRKEFSDKSNILFAFQQYLTQENMKFSTQRISDRFFLKDINKEQQRESTGQLDYSFNIWKFNIFTGVKGILRNNNAKSFGEAVGYEIPSGVVQPPESLNYTQHIFSGYITAGREFKKISIELGLRAENADLSAEVPNMESHFNNNSLNLFPSLSTSIKFNQEQNLNFKFSKKIKRPSVAILNPFTVELDPQNNLKGNPSVGPEMIYYLELGYSRNFTSTFFLVSPYLSNTLGSIKRFAYASADQKLINEYYNVGSERLLGISVYISKSIGDFEIGTTWDGMYSSLRGKNQFTSLSNSGRMYRISGNLGWKLPKGYSLNGSWTFNSQSISIQGREAGYSTEDISLTRSFFSKRLRATIMLSDFFTKNGRFQSDYHSSGFTRDELYQYNTTSGTLSLSYDFGLSKFISNTRKSINNNDIKQN